jgi:hypothetical protein
MRRRRAIVGAIAGDEASLHHAKAARVVSTRLRRCAAVRAIAVHKSAFGDQERHRQADTAAFQMDPKRV